MPQTLKFITFILIVCFYSLPAPAQGQNGYLETLFSDIDQREKDKSYQPKRIYNQLIDKSPAYKLLNRYPDLVVGKIKFIRTLPVHLSNKRNLIEKGQRLIEAYIFTSNEAQKSYNFKSLIDHLNTKLKNSSLSDDDWILIASAFRSLAAPGTTNKVNALGIYISEYIILTLIYNLEEKKNRTKAQDEKLSTLYYILSEIYQGMIHAPHRYNLVQKRAANTSGPLYFAFERPYLPYEGYADVILVNSTVYDAYYIPYANPYGYFLCPGFHLSFDIFFGSCLDLWGTAVIVSPDYYYAWVPIIDFCSVGFISPFYQTRLSPVFWRHYFPQGMIGTNPKYFKRLHNRWNRIAAHDPTALRNVRDRSSITRNLRDLQTIKGRERFLSRELVVREEAQRTNALTRNSRRAHIQERAIPRPLPQGQKIIPRVKEQTPPRQIERAQRSGSIAQRERIQRPVKEPFHKQEAIKREIHAPHIRPQERPSSGRVHPRSQAPSIPQGVGEHRGGKR